LARQGSTAPDECFLPIMLGYFYVVILGRCGGLIMTWRHVRADDASGLMNAGCQILKDGMLCAWEFILDMLTLGTKINLYHYNRNSSAHYFSVLDGFLRDKPVMIGCACGSLQ